MKVSEAINQANSLRDNVLTDEQKAAWLYQLEGEVADFMNKPVPVNEWPEQDAQLLMQSPHDIVYPLYLVAMIDYYNQESTLYANDMTIYNSAMTAARAWWRRNNKPKEGNYWGVM